MGENEKPRITITENPRAAAYHARQAQTLAIKPRACPAGGIHEWRWPEDRACAKCGLGVRRDAF